MLLNPQPLRHFTKSYDKSLAVSFEISYLIARHKKPQTIEETLDLPAVEKMVENNA